jgi:hypothetical protein
MRISYKGKDDHYRYRIAEISYKDEELEKVDKLIALMEDKDWYIQNVSLGYALCVVENKEDYKELVKDWKLCKKSLKG